MDYKELLKNYTTGHSMKKTYLVLAILWMFFAIHGILWGLGFLKVGVGFVVLLLTGAVLNYRVRITENTELNQLTELHQKIVMNAPVGLFSYDLQGNLTMVNKHYYKIAEIEDVELSAKINKVNLFDVTKNVTEATILKEIIENGKEYYLKNLKIKLKSGKEKYISFKAVPLHKHKQIIGGLAIIEDVTERKQKEEQIVMLSRAVEQSPSMVLITDTEGIIRYINSKYLQVTGYTPEELIGKTPRVLRPGKNPPEIDGLRKAITFGSEWRGELQLKKKNGEIYWSSTAVSPIRNSEGEIINFLALEEDVTLHKLTEEALREIALGPSAATGMTFFRSLVLHIAKLLGIKYVFIGELTGENKESIQTVATCIDGKIVDNIKFSLKNTPCAEAVKDFQCFNSKAFRESFPNDYWLFSEGIESFCGAPLFDSKGQVLGELVVMDTKPFREEYLVKALLQIFAVRATAELERKQIEEKINHLAYHDELTNLPNRRLFFDQVEQELINNKGKQNKLAVLFLDLDRLKLINDTLGHSIGDQLLRGVGERLKQCVGEGITIARLGGDEFAVLLVDNTSIEAATEVAELIIETIKQPWFLSGHEIYVTTSIGISFYPQDGESAQVLLKHADTAMYLAKQLGRNNYQLCTQAMAAKSQEQLVLENTLSRAVEHGELLVYYQPKVNIKTKQIIGMEALVRWQHPEQGLVFPDLFITIAEETGLIVSIGEWVLRAACIQNITWQRAGLPPLRVSVNISARQLQQRNLVDTVARILLETGLDARWLELEITESAIMKDMDTMVKVLEELRDMGVHIALDDFGTGYSSLGYLKEFPINTIKIDRSFVRDLPDNKNAAIASAIIAMAHSLGQEVIAEGVETEAQRQFLEQRQCQQMQGFLFGKPMPAQLFEQYLQSSWPFSAGDLQ